MFCEVRTKEFRRLREWVDAIEGRRWNARMVALDWAKEVGKGGTPEATLELAAKVLKFLEEGDE